MEQAHCKIDLKKHNQGVEKVRKNHDISPIHLITKMIYFC